MAHKRRAIGPGPGPQDAWTPVTSSMLDEAKKALQSHWDAFRAYVADIPPTPEIRPDPSTMERLLKLMKHVGGSRDVLRSVAQWLTSSEQAVMALTWPGQGQGRERTRALTLAMRDSIIVTRDEAQRLLNYQDDFDAWVRLGCTYVRDVHIADHAWQMSLDTWAQLASSSRLSTFAMRDTTMSVARPQTWLNDFTWPTMLRQLELHAPQWTCDVDRVWPTLQTLTQLTHLVVHWNNWSVPWGFIPSRATLQHLVLRGLRGGGEELGPDGLAAAIGAMPELRMLVVHWQPIIMWDAAAITQVLNALPPNVASFHMLGATWESQDAWTSLAFTCDALTGHDAARDSAVVVAATRASRKPLSAAWTLDINAARLADRAFGTLVRTHVPASGAQSFVMRTMSLERADDLPWLPSAVVADVLAPDAATRNVRITTLLRDMYVLVYDAQKDAWQWKASADTHPHYARVNTQVLAGRVWDLDITLLSRNHLFAPQLWHESKTALHHEATRFVFGTPIARSREDSLYVMASVFSFPATIAEVVDLLRSRRWTTFRLHQMLGILEVPDPIFDALPPTLRDLALSVPLGISASSWSKLRNLHALSIVNVEEKKVMDGTYRFGVGTMADVGTMGTMQKSRIYVNRSKIWRDIAHNNPELTDLDLYTWPPVHWFHDAFPTPPPSLRRLSFTSMSQFVLDVEVFRLRGLESVKMYVNTNVCYTTRIHPTSLSPAHDVAYNTYDEGRVTGNAALYWTNYANFGVPDVNRVPLMRIADTDGEAKLLVPDQLRAARGTTPRAVLSTPLYNQELDLTIRNVFFTWPTPPAVRATVANVAPWLRSLHLADTHETDRKSMFDYVAAHRDAKFVWAIDGDVVMLVQRIGRVVEVEFLDDRGRARHMQERLPGVTAHEAWYDVTHQIDLRRATGVWERSTEQEYDLVFPRVPVLLAAYVHLRVLNPQAPRALVLNRLLRPTRTIELTGYELGVLAA